MEVGKGIPRGFGVSAYLSELYMREIDIEIKSLEATKKVVSLIEKYIEEKKWNYSQFIISSFDWNALRKVHFLNQNIRIGVLTESDLPLAFSFALVVSQRHYKENRQD